MEQQFGDGRNIETGKLFSDPRPHTPEGGDGGPVQGV
jgi:hypothetical protein